MKVKDVLNQIDYNEKYAGSKIQMLNLPRHKVILITMQTISACENQYKDASERFRELVRSKTKNNETVNLGSEIKRQLFDITCIYVSPIFLASKAMPDFEFLNISELLLYFSVCQEQFVKYAIHQEAGSDEQLLIFAREYYDVIQGRRKEEDLQVLSVNGTSISDTLFVTDEGVKQIEYRQVGICTSKNIHVENQDVYLFDFFEVFKHPAISEMKNELKERKIESGHIHINDSVGLLVRCENKHNIYSVFSLKEMNGGRVSIKNGYMCIMDKAALKELIPDFTFDETSQTQIKNFYGNIEADGELVSGDSDLTVMPVTI